jgi:hypothetical protein
LFLVTIVADDENLRVSNGKDFKAAMDSIKSSAPHKPDLAQYHGKSTNAGNGRHKEETAAHPHKKKHGTEPHLVGRKKKHNEFEDLDAVFGTLSPKLNSIMCAYFW